MVAGINEVNVGRWLNDNIDGFTSPYSYSLIAGGRSNLTYKVTDSAGRHVVLRRPPLGHVLATAHDMAREHRIVSAIGSSSVPVPRTLGICTDLSVNDAPFYVMSFVEGVVLDSPTKGETLQTPLRRVASGHLIDVLADLHSLDVDDIGLGDLAKRTGYIERQVKRWTTQWENSKTRDLSAIDEVARILANNIPPQQGVVVAHGDYRFGNCLTDIATGQIVAVLDWELCTLGDPLADLGYIGVYWTDNGHPLLREVDPSGIEGFPKYAELVQRYADKTGHDVSNVGYYRAFSSWRLAIISEGVFARFTKGAMGDTDQDTAVMKASTEVLAESALQAVREMS
ncbi:MAG: phosphotransferase family protein [Ilumatobacteraceae bacterium]|nr:phosphotransferase family protein [Ilumatobacteraceae bacterium]